MRLRWRKIHHKHFSDTDGYQGCNDVLDQAIMVTIPNPPLSLTSSSTLPLASRIHRVVTCFLVTQSDLTSTSAQVAIFHRCATMPTFPNHWAGISGTIEAGELPHQAAQRELFEETNLESLTCNDTNLLDEIVKEHSGGLFLDVFTQSKRNPDQTKIIRVYPFLVEIPPTFDLEMRGTEHDQYKWISVDDFQSDTNFQFVPGLVDAFHHATFGKYNSKITTLGYQWAADVQNGASVMAQNALQLALQNPEWAPQLAMLRPSMVSIVNLMTAISKASSDHERHDVATRFRSDVEVSVTYGMQELQTVISKLGVESTEGGSELIIGTFSRSGTLTKILQGLLSTFKSTGFDPWSRIRIVCCRSTPGGEGNAMADDLQRYIQTAGIESIVECLDDEDFSNYIQSGKMDLLLIGADCIYDCRQQWINKIGTRALCEVAREQDVPVYCCTDRWKLWDDIFPPPLETELFEILPASYMTALLLPES